jgi:hypothetical protein
MTHRLRLLEDLAQKKNGRRSPEASVQDIIAALDPSSALRPQRRECISRIMTLLSRFEATLPGNDSK